MARDRREDGYRALFHGKAEEHWAAGMFTNWLWVTARPEPDIGADLIVEIPSYHGSASASFAVQARSHSDWLTRGNPQPEKLEAAVKARPSNAAR